MIRSYRLVPLIGLLLASLSLAQPPSAALDYLSDDALQAEAALGRAVAELRRSQIGLSGSLEFDPGLNYFTDYVDPAELDFFFDVELDVDFQYDAAAILFSRRNVVRAEELYHDQRRRDIETALLIHIELLRARNAIAIEELDLANEQERFAGVQEAFDTGQVTQAQLDAAQLAVEADQTALDRAQVRVDRARSDAVSRGLGTSPSFEVLQFVLPDPAPERTFDYQELMLELQRADAAGLQSSVFGVLESVGLEATYELDDYTFGGNINLNRGRPGAGLNAGLDFPFDETGTSLEITLGFDIRIDDRTFDDFAEAERDLAEAQADLEEYLTFFAISAERDRQDVDFAWEDLQRALRQLDINRARIAEVEAQLVNLPDEVVRLRTEADALRARRDAASGEERDNLNEQLREADNLLRNAEGQLGRAQSDLVNLNNGLPRSLDAVYGEWRDYVRAVEDYLGLVDGPWTLPE